MSKLFSRKYHEKNKEEIPEGDLLERQGQSIRRWSLVIGVLVTSVLTLLVFGVVKQIINDSLFYLTAAIFTFGAVAMHGFDSSIKPGYVGILSWWGYLLPIYVGHGTHWVPKIFGVKFEPIDVRVKVIIAPDTEKLDKNEVKTKYKRIRVKIQIVRPRAYKLNTTDEMADDGVISSTNEALREYTSTSTYKKCNQLTSEVEEAIKKNIEKKLAEEQDWGLNVTSVEIGEVEGSEIVEKEDQELRTRRKRMDLVNTHAKQLEKRGLSPKDAIEQVKIIHGITPEKIEKAEKEHTIEIGENTRDSIGSLLGLLFKEPKKKESKNE